MCRRLDILLLFLVDEEILFAGFGESVSAIISTICVNHAPEMPKQQRLYDWFNVVIDKKASLIRPVKGITTT